MFLTNNTNKQNSQSLSTLTVNFLGKNTAKSLLLGGALINSLSVLPSHAQTADAPTVFEPLYILGEGGYAVGDEDLENGRYWALGLGYEFNQYFDAQWGINQIPNSALQDSDVEMFAGFRGKLPLSTDYALYASAAMRAQGDGSQAGVGVLYKHNDYLTFDAGYRFFSVPNSAEQGDVYSFGFGFQYYFGKHFAKSSVNSFKPAPKPAPVVVAPKPVPVVAPKPKVESEPIVLTKYKEVLDSGSFDLNSAVLGAKLYARLDKLVELLTRYPQAKTHITGHTDSIGSYESNQLLSEKRANAIANYITNAGIDQARLVVKGAGEKEPVATNMYKAGRAKNRRVEIVIPEFTYKQK